MYKGKLIAAVVPAYNEEKLIRRVIETMPEFVDKIIIVNDCSKDQTSKSVKDCQARGKERILLIEHEINQGVGGAIATGFKWCCEQNIDVVVVMDGDGQMNPNDMPALLDPVVAGEVDYSKGNRLVTGDAWKRIPKVRYLGNAAMSMLTKIASGYWHVADSQCGYCAISLKALKAVNWERMFKRYGHPNCRLTLLNIANMRVCDVPVEPVYGIGEKSGIKPIRMIPQFSWLLLRLFVRRMLHKYVIRDFHPLVLFYLSGIILTVNGAFYGLYMIIYRHFGGSLSGHSPLLAAFLFITGWQFILFAMWFDMEYCKKLNKNSIED